MDLRHHGKIISKRRSNFLLEEDRGHLVKFMKALGLPNNVASHLSKRSKRHIREVDQLVQGLIDSFLLATPEEFCSPAGLKRMKRLVRWIISTATYSVQTVIDCWKAYTQKILYEVSGMDHQSLLKTRTDLIDLSGNPFTDRIFSSVKDLTKADLVRLGHLISTRHLPPGSKKKVEETFDKHKESLSEPYDDPGNEFLVELESSARRLGRRCKTLMEERNVKPKAHFSFSTSGSFLCSRKDGGCAREASKDLVSGLNQVLPPGIYDSFIGEMVSSNGELPFYKHAYRSEVLQGNLFDHLDGGLGIGKVGVDDILALQIMYIAGEVARKTGGLRPDFSPGVVCCRASAVQEPGGKVRIVTASEWWLGRLLQPAGHFLRECLAVYPPASDGFTRGDQVYGFLKRAMKCEYPKDTYTLSNDLSESTDHCPFVVSKRLLKGFLDGLSLGDSIYFNRCVDLLCSSRLIEYPDGSWLLSTRGSLMGEPLTKVVLTLYGLTAEDLALRKSQKIPSESGVIKQPTWHCFAIAGDDLIARGPMAYLEKIMIYLSKMGMKIGDKALLSKTLGRYCERIIDARANFSIDPGTNNQDLKDSNPCVDYVKLRLMSPTTKSQELQDVRNPALGKSRSLMKTLQWLDVPLRGTFSDLVYHRFIDRMYPFLPSRTRTKLWSVLRIPIPFGGAGISYRKDQYLPTTEWPKALQWAGIQIQRIECPLEIKTLLSTMSRNQSFHGTALDEGWRIVFDNWFSLLEPMSLTEAREMANISASLPARHVVSELRRKGWIFSDDLDEVIRKSVFINDLLNEKTIKGFRFNIERWSKRWTKLFNGLYKAGSVPLTREQKIKFNEFVQGIDAETFKVYSCLPPWAQIGFDDFDEVDFDESSPLPELNEFGYPVDPSRTSFAEWVKTGLVSLDIPKEYLVRTFAGIST